MRPLRLKPSNKRTSERRPGGFTLVELLVVIAIIAILASLFLAGMSVTAESARVQKTQALIAKINNIIMARWETYRTRRVPITVGTTPLFQSYYASSSNFPNAPLKTVVAAQRLDALRELMRLEMPQVWTDVTYMPYGTTSPPVSSSYFTSSGSPPNLFAMSYSISSGSVTPNAYGQAPPSPWLAYARKYATIRASHPSVDPASSNANAECLYMICTTGVSDELSGQDLFSADEFADTDQDGFPEFIDAWGTPIMFFRWAPGFVSELQPGWRRCNTT